MTDGDILQIHVYAGIAGLYPDVLTAPLRPGEDVLEPLEVISPHTGGLSLSRALVMK